MLGEMSLKKTFVDRDVLEHHRVLVRHVLGDPVNQQEWVPVGDRLENAGKAGSADSPVRLVHDPEPPADWRRPVARRPSTIAWRRYRQTGTAGLPATLDPSARLRTTPALCADLAVTPDFQMV